MDQLPINDIRAGRNFTPSSTPATDIRLAAGTRGTIKKKVAFGRNVNVSARFPPSVVVSRAVRVEYKVKQTVWIPGDYVYNPEDLPPDSFLPEVLALWPNPLQKITAGGTVRINTSSFETGADNWLMTQTLMTRKERRSEYGSLNGDAVYVPSGLTTGRMVQPLIPYPHDDPPLAASRVVDEEAQATYLDGQLLGEEGSSSKKRKKVVPLYTAAARRNVRAGPPTADVYIGSAYRRSPIGAHLEKLDLIVDMDMYITGDQNLNSASVEFTTVYESTVNLAPLISKYYSDRESGMLGVDLMHIDMILDLEALAAGAMAMPLTPISKVTAAIPKRFNVAWPDNATYEVSDLTFSFDYVSMLPIFNTITSGGSFFPYRELSTHTSQPGHDDKCYLNLTTSVVPSLILLYLVDDWPLSINKMQGLSATGSHSAITGISISLGSGADQQLKQLNWRDLVAITRRNGYQDVINQRARLTSVHAQLGPRRDYNDPEARHTDGLHQQYPVLILDPSADLDMDYGAANSLKNMQFGFEVTTTSLDNTQEGFPLKLRVGLVQDVHMTSAELLFDRVPAQFTGDTVANVYRAIQNGEQDIVM